MPSISVMGFFCEDIREEKNDIITLVGLIPDNAGGVPQGPPAQPGATAIWPKVCMFMRINFEPQTPITTASMHLVMPNGRQKLAEVDTDFIDNARRKAIDRGNPLAGIIFRATAAALPLSSGVIRLEADIDGETYLAAALNVIVPSPASVSAPPSEQFPSASASIETSP